MPTHSTPVSGIKMCIRDRFDGIPESDIKPCTEKMLDYLHTNCTAAENAVKATGDLSDESAERLKEALNLFKESYLNGEHK